MKKIVNFIPLIILVICLLLFYKFITKDNNTYNDIDNNKNTNVEEKNKNEVKLTLVGDLLFESPFYKSVEKDGKDKYFSLVKDYFESDDISIGNMEVVIGNESLKVSGDGYNFCAPSWVGDLVSTLDFEVLGTANNHAFDRGKEGIVSTIDYFKNTDILTTGTRENTTDSYLIYLEKNNMKFGITAYTYSTNIKSNDNLINYYKDSNGILKDKIKEDINTLKNNSDVVIVIMHWGKEFQYEPNSEQKELANYLNSLGVDIIMGSHSHNISPIEVIGSDHKTLVYYSLGNFVSADDDIARTPKKEEEFDNAYQFGLLSSIKVIKDNDNITIDNVNTEIIVNYFDKNMNNFMLIPLDKYTEDYEHSHYRYSYGLTKEFINNTYNKVINEKYR